MMANLVAGNNENGGLSPNRKKALCGGFRSLGRRVGRRTADYAAEREYAAFSRRLLNDNMPPVSFTTLSQELQLARKAVANTRRLLAL